MRRTLYLALLAALTMLVFAPAAASGQPDGERDEGYETTRGKSQPKYTEFVTEQYRVETEHGTIYGEVKRPVVPDGVDVPVILTYSPYNVLKSPSPLAGSTADDSVADYFAPRGYARAVFDVVGTRESSGCYDYGGIAERETGAAVVDFLGTRDWSNGKAGMIGGSYDGTTQISAAIEAPEHLTAIIPQVAIDRWYDYAYGGGIRYFLNSERPTDEGFDTPLAFDFGFGFLPPTDPTQPQFADALADHINPCERIQHTEYGYDPDPVYDEFWDERDYRSKA
ncbi:MAG: CocE/NonD family hydrolase, partial [Rubrobacteraceae bacterium]